MSSIPDWDGTHLGPGPIALQAGPSAEGVVEGDPVLLLATRESSGVLALGRVQLAEFLRLHPHQTFLFMDDVELPWRIQAHLSGVLPVFWSTRYVSPSID